MEKDPTLKQILLNHLNSQENWVTKGELGLVAEKNGYLPESVGRHLRSMAEKRIDHEPEILVSYYQGKRKQKLSRYARLGVMKLIVSKPKYEQVLVDGMWVARLLTN